MSSNRNVGRRGAVPASLNPHAKQIISVEDWEAKAPLSELETRSINAVKSASERKPLPLKFEEKSPSRPSTPRNNRLLAPNSRPATPKILHAHALHPKQPVQTPQQFYDWFALVDRSVAHSQEAHFRAHVASVSGYLETCDVLVERVDEVDSLVEGMLDGWKTVEDGGRSLKDACERLLEERDGLIALTDEIDARLEYFQELEHATRMLNHPGESLVLQTDFLYMVERVDTCISYLKAHRHFREADIYLLRFQQCMTRAMTLIKMFFVGSLRALSLDIGKRLSEKDVSSTAQTHLLYTRFHTVSNQLAPLLGELERRAKSHPNELMALLSECHTAYFNARKSLLVGRITEEIRGLDPTRTELVELTRAGCSYLKQLCTDEFSLFREFFNSGETRLYQYLENLCDYLYDDLRPRILHEPRLTALCEVCTVLQALMVLDIADIEAEEEDTDDEDGARPQLHISHLLQMVLQDAQTRLFFKAQAVVQSDIRYYVPKPEDLAYPDKLLQNYPPTSAVSLKEKESISEIFRLPSLERQETWYPTLQKTLWVLSQLHDFVKPTIFEDIAQEALSLCMQSLLGAAETIKTRSRLDGELFLTRHLLILKEISTKITTDNERIGASAFTDTLATVLKSTALLPNTLFVTLGMPKGDEEALRGGIDDKLRRTCEDVIAECAGPICTPLRSWIDSPTTPPQDVNNEFKTNCERDLRGNVNRMRLYLEDGRTAGVLLQHVQDRISDAYGAFKAKIWNSDTTIKGEELLTSDELKGFLKNICDNSSNAVGSTSSL